jgi:hypothetical protein
VDTKDTVRVFEAPGYVVRCPILLSLNVFPKVLSGSMSPGLESARFGSVSYAFVAKRVLAMLTVPLALTKI